MTYQAGEIELLIEGDCSEHRHELRRRDLGQPLEPFHADGEKCERLQLAFWPEAAQAAKEERPK